MGQRCSPRIALDGWQISGITIMQNQPRNGFTYAFTGAPTNDLSGNGYAAPRDADVRPEPAAQRADVRPSVPHRVHLSPAAARAIRTTWGPRPTTSTTRRGTSTTTSRSSRTSRSDSATLQFRAELYNAFNTTQYQDVDTSAVFDYATGQQTDTNFGRVTGVRPNTTASSSWASGSASKPRITRIQTPRITRITRQEGASSGRPLVCTGCR